MTYKTHLTTGLLFSSVYFLQKEHITLTPVLLISLILATALGSSAPDLDTPSGELWDKVPAGGVLSRIVKPVFIGGHRHLSHSLIGLGFFNLLFYFLVIWLDSYFSILDPARLLLAFNLGLISHLFMDMFTEAGVPLLFPLEYHFGIPPNPFQKFRIKTGKWFENLLIYPAVSIILFVLVIEYIIAL